MYSTLDDQIKASLKKTNRSQNNTSNTNNSIEAQEYVRLRSLAITSNRNVLGLSRYGIHLT